MRDHPDWIVKKPIDMTSSLNGYYREDIVGVSHRWAHQPITPTLTLNPNPDPDPYPNPDPNPNPNPNPSPSP